jgi:GNAT superfamily N-acetyltransferase
MWSASNAEIIAYCQGTIINTGDNEHLVRYRIEVLPEYRRQGIGRESLKKLLPFAKKHQRTLWISFTWDNVPSTTFFFERIGARRGSEMKTNQLKINEFDKSLVEHWLEKSTKLKDKFDLGIWDGKYPDEEIEAVAGLFQDVANDAPRDTLEMEDMNFSSQLLRDLEKNMFAIGEQRWTIYAKSRKNVELAGLTEVFWHPNRAMILNQGFTGVYPQYRNKGIGRWLKAEMMKKILSEHPEIKFIRTGNANSNAPMLKINVEMGFKPYIANTIWQVETDKVEKYLSD